MASAKKRKTPAEALSSFSAAEEQLKADRKTKAAEAELRAVKAKLAASEKEVESLRGRIEIFNSLKDVKAKKITKGSKRHKSGHATAVLMLSDLHCEEEIKPEKVNWLNEYNLEICEQSLEQVFRRYVMLLNQERMLVDIDEMVLWIGGDLFTGNVPAAESAEVCLLPVMAACRWIQERLEGGIQFLLDHANLKKIRIVTSAGNHSRNTLKRMIATEIEHSYEYNLYKIMEAKMTDPRLEWIVEDGYLTYLDVEGWMTRWHHGSALRYYGGMGGIATTINKAINAWDQQVKSDFTFSGHLHSHVYGGNFVSNASLIGHSPFAVEIKAKYEEPSQTFCVIDPDRGLTVVKRIFCRPAFGSNLQRTRKMR